MSKRKIPCGNKDRLNLKYLYASSNDLGIPELQLEKRIPDFLFPYRGDNGVVTRLRSKQDVSLGALHFFTDDHRFEDIWNNHRKSLSVVKKTGLALTPDFSLYRGMPRVLQAYNTYRSRWVGRYWQEHGIKVIPSVTWAEEETFEFAFCGIKRGNNVAISYFRIRENRENWLFRKGFAEMIRQVQPSTILIYAESFPDEHRHYAEKRGIELRTYPTYWSGLRGKLRKSKDSSLNSL